MGKVKRSECYECTDGKVFKELSEAECHQLELNAKHELAFLVQDNTSTQDEEDNVFDFIWEHRYELSAILNFKMDNQA